MSPYNMHSAHDLNHNPRFGDEGTDFELDRFFKEHDPRRETIMEIDRNKVHREESYYKAIFKALEHNPAGYKGDELQDPPGEWINGVLVAIDDELEKEGYEGKLIVMPTLKTSADLHYGVDGIIVFTEDLTQRSVIITIDLTLRPEKDRLQAAVLANEYGATPNERYFHTKGIHTGEDVVVEGEELTGIRLKEYRRMIIGTTIGKMIVEKLRNEDARSEVPQRLRSRLRSDIDQLLRFNKSSSTQATGAV